MALAPFAGSLAALAAIGIALRHKGAKRSCATAEARARTALASSTDFTEANHARAKTLIAEARQPVTLNPADLRAASRQDGFNEHLAETLLSTVPFASDDDGPRAILHLSLTAAIAACRADDAFHRDLTQEMQLQAARDAGLQINLLQDIKEDTSALRTMMEQMLASQTANAARDQGLSEAAVIGLAKGIAPTVRNFDEAMTALGEAVKIANRLTASGDAGSNIDAFVDQVLRDLARLTRAGDFDAAAETAQAAADQAEAGMAQIFNAAIDAHLLARNADAAAAQIVKRVALDTPPDLFAALREEFQKRYTNGRNNGLRLELEVAIALARQLDTRAASPLQEMLSNWCLADGLTALGKLGASKEPLGDALKSYQHVADFHLESGNLRQWAITQINLGSVYQALGERGLGTKDFEKAIAARQFALDALDPTKAPQLWGDAKNNLGITLKDLGSRTNNPKMIETAVNCLEDALPYRSGLELAVTHSNLGNARSRLAQSSGLLKIHEQALSDYGLAIKIYSEEADATRLAQAQNNLANAIVSFCRIHNTCDRLPEAETACNDALKIRTQELMPFEWALTQLNLGWTLLLRAKHLKENDRLKDALDAFRAATKVFTPDHAPAEWVGAALGSGLIEFHSQ